MAIHLKVSAHKIFSPKDKATVSTGKVRAGKVRVSFKGVLRSAGNGFKSKLDAPGKAGGHKKEVKALKKGSHLQTEGTPQAALVLPEKNILSLYKKSAPRLKEGLKGGDLKIGPKGKGLLKKASAVLKKGGIERGAHLKGGQKGEGVKGRSKGKVLVREISTGFEKIAYESAQGQKGGLKAGGKGKGLLQETPILPEIESAEMFSFAKDRGKLSAHAHLVPEPTVKSHDSRGRVLSQRKAALPEAHKGFALPKKGLKGLGSHIKGGATRKGLKEALANKLPEKRHSDMDSEPTISSEIAGRPDTSSMKASLLETTEVAKRASMINPLKGPVSRGAAKKRRTAVRTFRSAKKGGERAAGLKKKALKAASLSVGVSSRVGARPFTETLKQMGEVNVTLPGGLPRNSTALLEAVRRGGEVLPLGREGDKAALRDLSALISPNPTVGVESAQPRGRAFATDLNKALAGREKEMIKMASGGVVMSLRKADKEVVISLDPEELGHMEIKVKLNHGLVDASILVENADVLALLNANGASLKEQLARQGLMLGGLEVALNGQEGSPQKQGDLQGEGGSNYGRGRQAVKGAALTGEAPLMAAKSIYEAGAQSRLDLFI